LNINRSGVEYTGVISVVSNLPKHIAERQVRSFKDFLENEVPGEKEYNIITLDRDRAFGPGTSILIYSKMENGVYVGGDDIGERGKPAETVGWNAYQKYMTWYKSKALFDPYMGDMIVPYLFLSKGRSRFSVPKLTKHIESALYVATTLTERKYRINRLEKAVEIIVD
jgi:RNA 3'-terminal phosphate cyclase (ATP)